MVPKKLWGYRLYNGVFAIAKRSGPRESLERRKGRAWRNALMLLIHPCSSFKIFSRIAWAWYWKSAILSTVQRICQHEDIWHQNGITEWQHQRHVFRLCYISSPPPSRPPLYPFWPCFSLFCWLRSWFQTIQIWSIRNRETILNER